MTDAWWSYRVLLELFALEIERTCHVLSSGKLSAVETKEIKTYKHPVHIGLRHPNAGYGLCVEALERITAHDFGNFPVVNGS